MRETASLRPGGCHMAAVPEECSAERDIQVADERIIEAKRVTESSAQGAPGGALDVSSVI